MVEIRIEQWSVFGTSDSFRNAGQANSLHLKSNGNQCFILGKDGAELGAVEGGHAEIES